MDWTQISLAVVAILGPFLTKAGEAASEKIGEELYDWLKQRFQKAQDDDAQMALAQLEKKPDSKPRRDALVEVLAERAAADPAGFGAELQSRVQKIAETRGNVGALVGQIIAGNANVINIMYGDIHM